MSNQAWNLVFEEQLAAVARAAALADRFAGLTDEEVISRFPSGVFVVQSLVETARLVVELDRLSTGLVLIDLRPAVGRLEHAAFRLEQGRLRSCERHINFARGLLAHCNEFLNRVARYDAQVCSKLRARRTEAAPQQ